MPRRRVLLIISGLVLVALVVGGIATWYFLFRDDSPPAPTIGQAAHTAKKNSSKRDTGGSTGALDGSWSVDTSVGSFSDFTSTFAGYRVQEQLAGIGAKTAVGRTPDVKGTLTLDGSSISATKVTVDMTTLRSDRSGRDGNIRFHGIETERFPTAEFELTQPIDLGSVPAPGQRVTVKATGNLTLHGVTRKIAFPLSAALEGDLITVTGSLEIQFADYDIQKPRAAVVLSVEDHGTIELQLF